MDELEREESLQLLREAPVGHLGVIDGDVPYVTPMSYVVVDDNRLLFRTMPGRKLDAIRNNPHVCVEVSTYDDETGDWASVIVIGEAAIVSDDDVKNEAVAGLLRKYEKVMGSPLSRGSGIQPMAGMSQVVEMTALEITGLASGRGWSRRTRPGRL